MDTVTEYPPHMQEYGFTLDDYQYLEMPQQDGENYTIHVMTQSGETEGLVFTSEDQGENWSFTGVLMKMTYHKKQSILNQYDPGKVKEAKPWHTAN